MLQIDRQRLVLDFAPMWNGATTEPVMTAWLEFSVATVEMLLPQVELSRLDCDRFEPTVMSLDTWCLSVSDVTWTLVQDTFHDILLKELSYCDSEPDFHCISWRFSGYC